MRTFGLLLLGCVLGIVATLLLAVSLSKYTLGSFYYCGYGVGLNDAAVKLEHKPTFKVMGICEKIKIFVETIP